MGDSAGGHLVISTTIELIKQEENLPLAAVAFSPWTGSTSIVTKRFYSNNRTIIDVTLSGASYVNNDGKDPTLRTARAKLIRDLAGEFDFFEFIRSMFLSTPPYSRDERQIEIQPSSLYFYRDILSLPSFAHSSWLLRYFAR